MTVNLKPGLFCGLGSRGLNMDIKNLEDEDESNILAICNSLRARPIPKRAVVL
jgi:hypothetical protein